MIPHHQNPSFQGVRVLFVHQNFPGQFVHLAPALQAAGAEVRALGIGGRGVAGIDMRRYTVTDKPLLPQNDLGADIEVKLRRASACAQAMLVMQAQGFQPDLVVAHPGWGESLFCKDIWPDAVVVAYGEFYYQAHGADHGFDPEFGSATTRSQMQLRLRNTALLHAYTAADAILCPTNWQKSVLPKELQHKATTIFDGIDTARLAPDAKAVVRLGREGLVLRPGDPVITLINRNMEPYRGFHVFMRMLPELLARNPSAHVVIVGEDGVSYGARPPNHRTWREAMLHEVGARLPMDRLHFVGRVAYADYVRLLQVSACHVYLTYPFVLSWSCLEAMSVGCLVAASRTAPVLDAIEDGVHGRLVDFFDQAGWVHAISQALLQPEIHVAMRQAARARAQQQFDLKTVCLPQQMQWLASLLGLH
jgi:glycosyltransferase involved in cell wall biosynthesis